MEDESQSDREKRPNYRNEGNVVVPEGIPKKDKLYKSSMANKHPSSNKLTQMAEMLMDGASGSTSHGPVLESIQSSPAPIAGTIPSMFTNVITNKEKDKEGKIQPKNIMTGQQCNEREVVNLSSYNLSLDEVEVLRKGLSFCPDQELNIFDAVKDIHLFARKLVLKVLMEKSHSEKLNYNELFKGYTVADFKALKEIILLMQENQKLGALDSWVFEQDIDSLMARSEEIQT